MRRKICIVTGTRAEYGLLFGLMKEIGSDQDLQLQIVATAMHLSPEFGMTYKQIESDGFKIDYKLEMLLSSDSSVGLSKSLGLGIIGFADAFDRLSPDIVVVLGDRFEILAAAQAAMIARIPIAHIHGGETSEGAFDENIRHALTKLAQWHFVAAEPYRMRVIQLGESPERVFDFGAPGLDNFHYLSWMDLPALELSLQMQFKSPLLVVTYHPETLGDRPPDLAMNELLKALDHYPEASVVLTYPNADTGGRSLIRQINDWVAANQHRAKAFSSLGQQRYLSLVRQADVIVGNSSSGLIEVPYLKKATVNLGDRQKGRLKATSVIDALEEKDDITRAIDFALSSEFQNNLSATKSLYGSGNVNSKIKHVLKTTACHSQKSFFNIQHGY